MIDRTFDPDAIDTTAVVTAGRKGIRIQGVWPGWPLAITLLMYTQDDLHPANKEIADLLADLHDRPNDHLAVRDLEYALDHWGFIVLEDGDTLQTEVSSREYFEVLQDATRKVMCERALEGDLLRFGPYLLRDGPFVERDYYALTPR